MMEALRPTLVRRVLVALMLAFALVWGVLMLVQQRDDLERIQRDRKTFAGALAAVLDKAGTESEAMGAVALAERMANDMRRQQGIPGNVLLQLQDIGTNRALRAGVSTSSADEVVSLQAGRWAVRIMVPPFDEPRWARMAAVDMLRYLSIAFPLVLLPMWLAVSRGLQPLKQLSALIASRSPHDLSPLKFNAMHAELAPLTSALNQLLEQLHARMEREHAFVHDAAHELRTPIAAIAAQAHVLGMAADPQDRREAQAHLEQAVTRTSHLIQQLLALARVDAGALTQVAEVNLPRLIRQELVQASGAAMRRSMEISLEAPDQLLAWVDPMAFQSALRNLLDNAVHHGRDGGRVCVRLEQQGNIVSLHVLDDGPGIPASERSRVFERFHRGAAHDRPGSGLGLAIVRQAARRMAGDVILGTGLDGRGCGFSITWPVGGGQENFPFPR